ncbi:MAG TPA: MFS transporter [Steroidobacteraceae bacterium]|nr:MFS transporter [Steroidobacteraceae bacterium]
MSSHHDGNAHAVAGARQALVLICLNAMPILANASLVPSLPNFLKHFAAVPGANFWVPMIITLPTLCIGLFSAVAGVLADRWGRRRLILAALGVFVACGMAPLLLDELHWILLARVGLGIAEACTLTAGNALMGDYFSGETRRKWLSYETILGPIVGSGVLISGGYLGTLWWRGPFLLYGIGLLVLIGVLLLVWEPERKQRETVDATVGSFPWKTAALVSAGTLIAAMPFFSQNIQHGRIFAALGLSSSFDISLYAMMASVGTVLGAYTFRILPVRRIEQILTLVFGLFAISFIALSFKPPLGIGTAIDAIGQLAGGMCYPAVLAWALSRFPPEYRGRGVGVWSGSFYVGSFVSGVVIGVIGRFTDGFLQSLGVIGFACAAISVGLLIANLRAGSSAPSRSAA